MEKQSCTINEIVHELKLEVEPSATTAELAAAAAAVSAATGGPNNSESILPHVGSQTIGYGSQVQSTGSVNERDPLDVVDRNNDSL